MKKSTILLLVVVYIVSFFIIGLLGHSVKNYDPKVYPENIEVVELDGKTTLTRDVLDPDTGEKAYDYYFLYKNYKSGDSVRIKAFVKPDNCTYPNVSFTKDQEDTSFVIKTIKDDDKIEQNQALIILNETEDMVVSAPFFVATDENSGKKIRLKICVTFVFAF